MENKKQLVKVVFDVDDVLWPLGDVIAKRLGIEPARYYYHFKVTENPKLNRHEQEAIIAAFADAELFKDMEFFPDIENILRPRELGATVAIKSNSFSKEIASLKIQRLLATIPGLQESDIKMNIIDYSKTHSKEIDADTTIFIDDSPFNVSTSPAKVNVMPKLGGWNGDESAQQLIHGKTVIYAENLSEINKIVYKQVEQLLIS